MATGRRDDSAICLRGPRRTRTRTPAELQAQLDHFGAYYNNKVQLNRALGRCTRRKPSESVPSSAVTKTDALGSRIVKEQKSSGRRIDLAVAAVMAHDLVSRE